MPPNKWAVTTNGFNSLVTVHIPSSDYFVATRFQREQPLAMLHELAHAYHDQVLGFDNAEVKAAFERAKAGGTYDRVEQRFGDGRSEKVRAYAITNPRGSGAIFAIPPECGF